MASEELGATVENFASRIRRKLKEQELQQSESFRAANARQTLILKAMTGIRKALSDAAKISLGERFSFQLDMSDWEGWPRLELRLVDQLAPDMRTQALVASANDRNENGALQLSLKSGEILGTLQLTDDDEFQKVPLLLKKSLRTFLDLVSHTVLNPTKATDTLGVQTRAVEGTEDGLFGVTVNNDDLFTEDLNQQDNNRAEIDDPQPSIALSFSSPLKA